ncbi:anthranilate synthase component I family protein [Paenibacillus sediminis]|nr:anthranilate synthase component I family protein [Paenibacillus sediminis]
MLPYIIKIDNMPIRLPSSWEKAWQEASPYSFVLESGKEGQYTFMGLHPVSIIRGKGNRALVQHSPSGEESWLQGKPLEMLEEWMSPFRSPYVQGAPKFGGGCVGYLSYDVARSLEELPQQAADDLELPDYVWMQMDEIWAIDMQEGALYCIVHVPFSVEQATDSHPNTDELERLYEEAAGRAAKMRELWQEINDWGNQPHLIDRLEEWRGILQNDQANSMTDSLEGSTPFPQEQFEQAVRRIQEYIARGDVFQVNLSLRREFPLRSTPEHIYEWLRLLNPSPYMGMLRFPDFQLVSASPELLIKVEQGNVSARPIAGTRRRGSTPEEDEAMAKELLGTEKERAEHIMLVDLERNDIGRIAEYGSVNVSELMTIEYYSHVMHLVSQVEGRLAKGRNVYDVIAAVFPGGTITGAPKVRTMEIIEELEPVTRGPYTGSMGWIDYNGNMELNIIIRTLVVKDRTGYIQTGAGIVIDSAPYREYRECLNKGRATIKAVQYSEQTADQ